VNQYMHNKVPGFIRNVRFRNVTLEGSAGEYLVQIQGADAEHDVRGGGIRERRHPGLEADEGIPTSSHRRTCERSPD